MKLYSSEATVFINQINKVYIYSTNLQVIKEQKRLILQFPLFRLQQFKGNIYQTERETFEWNK